MIARKQEPEMGNVVLLNLFEVPGGAKDEFLRQCDLATAHLQSQPGRARLRCALGPGARFRAVTVAGWTPPHDFQAAVASDGLRKLAEGTPSQLPVPGHGRPDAATEPSPIDVTSVGMEHPMNAWATMMILAGGRSRAA